MKQFEVYLCKIKIRHINGIETRDKANKTDGSVIPLMVGWAIEDGRFAGEYAMTEVNFGDLNGLAWIESGDVEVIKKL